jgi:prepilin peptidase CpaA
MLVDPQWIARFFLFALSGCMLWVAISDAWRYLIPNTLNALIIMLFALAALLLPVAPLPALGAAVIVLIIGLGLFTLGLMGGGDIKLLVALSLWTGWGIATLQFIFLTAVFGGALVFAVLLLRVVIPPLLKRNHPDRTLPRLLTKKQPVPYGIAIAAAFAWLLWTGNVVGLH